MRIGIVSDTHNHLRNALRIVEIFNSAGVDRVVHTGDITQPKTLDVFSALQAPLIGVYGNNDLEREALDGAAARHGFQLQDPPLEVRLAGRDIVVVHDPLELTPERRRSHRVAIHGHTHRLVLEDLDGTLVFNPGECAGHLPGRNAVGLLDLHALNAEILHF